MTKSVLILWSDDRSRNLGVRVLAQGTRALLSAALPGASVEAHDFGPGARGPSLGGRAVARDVVLRRHAIADYLADFDMIVDTGAGDSFTDIYGPMRLGVMLAVRREARRLGIPYAFGPQTFGPFAARWSRRLAARSVSGAAAVIARDSVSASYAASTLGRSDVTLATDVVFCLPPPVPASDRDVVVNVSGLLWRGSAHVEPLKYRESVLRLCRDLMAEGRGVTLLAHVLDSPYLDNDVPAVRAAAGELGGSVEVAVPESLEAARGILASANVVVASRMHASLNAISVGTPAVSLAYSRKFAPLMGDLGWPLTVDLRAEADPAGAALAALSDLPGAGAMAAVRERATTRVEVAVAAIRKAAE